MARNKSQVLCQFSDLDDLSSKGFKVKLKRKSTDIFIVKKDDSVYAYVNNCPHAHSPLEWNPDEFLDANKEMIICSFHGAKFKIEDGACISGACDRAPLTALQVSVINDQVVLQL